MIPRLGGRLRRGLTPGFGDRARRGLTPGPGGNVGRDLIITPTDILGRNHAAKVRRLRGVLITGPTLEGKKQEREARDATRGVTVPNAQKISLAADIRHSAEDSRTAAENSHLPPADANAAMPPAGHAQRYETLETLNIPEMRAQLHQADREQKGWEERAASRRAAAHAAQATSTWGPLNIAEMRAQLDQADRAQKRWEERAVEGSAAANTAEAALAQEQSLPASCPFGGVAALPSALEPPLSAPRDTAGESMPRMPLVNSSSTNGRAPYLHLPAATRPFQTERNVSTGSILRLGSIHRLGGALTRGLGVGLGHGGTSMLRPILNRGNTPGIGPIRARLSSKPIHARQPSAPRQSRDMSDACRVHQALNGWRSLDTKVHKAQARDAARGVTVPADEKIGDVRDIRHGILPTFPDEEARTKIRELVQEAEGKNLEGTIILARRRFSFLSQEVLTTTVTGRAIEPIEVFINIGSTSRCIQPSIDLSR